MWRRWWELEVAIGRVGSGSDLNRSGQVTLIKKNYQVTSRILVDSGHGFEQISYLGFEQISDFGSSGFGSGQILDTLISSYLGFQVILDRIQVSLSFFFKKKSGWIKLESRRVGSTNTYTKIQNKMFNNCEIRILICDIYIYNKDIVSLNSRRFFVSLIQKVYQIIFKI
jgi:hypothetical protein